MMEVDSQETGFVLVRQGSCRNNSILKLREHNMIGRGFDVNIPIISLFISRKHCYIFKNASTDLWYVRDCGALNGTFINDDIVEPFIDHQLRIGDRIGLGINMSSLNHSIYSENDNYYVYKFLHDTVQYSYDINQLCMDLTKNI